MGHRGLRPGEPDYDPQCLKGASSNVGFLGTDPPISSGTLLAAIAILIVVGTLVALISH